MTLHVAPGSRRKVRTGSSKHDAAPLGSEISAAGPPQDVSARIAELAYQLYEQRGREDGYHVEDWFQAEQWILSGKS